MVWKLRLRESSRAEDTGRLSVGFLFASSESSASPLTVGSGFCGQSSRHSRCVPSLGHGLQARPFCQVPASRGRGCSRLQLTRPHSPGCWGNWVTML